jgi:H+/Cl- antiporter ClcA
MNQKSTPIRKIIKPRILGILDGLVAIILYEYRHYLYQLFGVKLQAPYAKFLILTLLVLLIVVFSFLFLYVYKFHVVNKALLEINPHFYEEREYGKWFDYYAKHAEKHK